MEHKRNLSLGCFVLILFLGVVPTACSFSQELVFYPESSFMEKDDHYEVIKEPWLTAFVVKREYQSDLTPTGKPEVHTLLFELTHVEEEREYYVPGSGKIIFIVKSGDKEEKTTEVSGEIFVVSASKTRICLDMELTAVIFDKNYKISGSFAFYRKK